MLLEGSVRAGQIRAVFSQENPQDDGARTTELAAGLSTDLTWVSQVSFALPGTSRILLSTT